MANPTFTRRVFGTAFVCTLLVLAAYPAQAAKIPEREYVPAGQASVIHIRVDSGCSGAPTDTVEVVVPAELTNVVPQAMPGWSVETETARADASRVALVRWSGGSLPDGLFMDFGLRAVFPDEPGAVLSFPVTQLCGDVVKVSRVDGSGTDPFVVVGEAIAPQDLIGLMAAVDELQLDVESIQEQVANVDSERLRERVSELRERLDTLESRIPEA